MKYEVVHSGPFPGTDEDGWSVIGLGVPINERKQQKHQAAFYGDEAEKRAYEYARWMNAKELPW